MYGTSEILETVLNECIAQGLAMQLTGNCLLVAHDIFLENSSKETRVKGCEYVLGERPFQGPRQIPAVL